MALFLAAPAALGAALLAYNLRVFGRSRADKPGLRRAVLGGFLGLLVSPGRGLLVYTPITVFAILGVVARLRSRDRSGPPVYLVSALFSLALILVMSKWRVWWGGHCYGPRLLTDIAPCLVLLVLPALERSGERSGCAPVAGGGAAASVFVQAIGAFCYPNSRWDETPVAVGERPARLWDWKDSPITRGLSAGPRLGPDAQARRRIRHVFESGPQSAPQP